MNDKFPGAGGSSYAVIRPAVGTKVEGQCPAPKTVMNLWPNVKYSCFLTQTFLIVHGIVLDLKFPNL